ncbi:AI-2E family transporter YdiK [Orbus mooreae]|uniref:AI-2E family transporter YdiK n=1 Tax=Orbus mooreae TaxID=3074107 RepID=UPI00370DCADB
MPAEKNTYDLLKLTLNLLIIGLFIIVTYRIVEPFLFGFFWAVMVVISTWPLMIKIQNKLFHKRILSVLVMTLILSLFFIIPFMLIIISITKNAGFLIEWGSNFSQQSLPTLDWLKSIPIVGLEAHQKWAELIAHNGAELIKEMQPYIGTMVSWLLDQMTNIGFFLFHCGVMVVFSALLYLKGEDVKKYIYHLAHRLSKQHGENTITLAGKSIRAVALGVVVTAITLAILGGLSFILTDVPFPGVLTLLMFICCVAQIGPVIVMIGAIIWQFWNDNIIAGIILIIVAAILTTLDSLMRAYLIKKGADLPFLLILFGVIGGLLAFGAMGLFIGPVILALSYNIICAWIEEQD